MTRESKRPSSTTNLISPDYGCDDVNDAYRDRAHVLLTTSPPNPGEAHQTSDGIRAMRKGGMSSCELDDSGR
jgi:hypothetical protein